MSAVWLQKKLQRGKEAIERYLSKNGDKRSAPAYELQKPATVNVPATFHAPDRIRPQCILLECSSFWHVSAILSGYRMIVLLPHHPARTHIKLQIHIRNASPPDTHSSCRSSMSFREQYSCSSWV